MSILKPPLIREKLYSEREISASVSHELEKQGFAPVGIDPLKDALVQVFARYCEILSVRLNRVPESHQGEFLSMLHATPAPATPARAPLAFKTVESLQNVKAVVPKHTQVSAQAEDGGEAVIFETERDLPLVQAELKQAVALDTRRLIYADVSSMVSTELPSGFAKPSLLTDAAPIVRAMHIALPDVMDIPKLTRLKLKFELDQRTERAPESEIEWGLQSETGVFMVQPESDTTVGLTRNGELVFIPPEKWPSLTIAGKTAPWLTCRLRPAISVQRLPAETNKYPAITLIEITGFCSLTAVPPIASYHGSMPLDTSRDFYPFGERPRFGEVFYLLSESFANPGIRVAVDIKLTNPAGSIDSPIPPVSKKGNPQIRWEAYTQRGWVAIDSTDGTLSLTQNGQIELTMPGDTASTMMNGVKGCWVRGRLTGGQYAADDTSTNPGAFPPVNPPSIASIQLTSTAQFGPVKPKHVIVESNFEYNNNDPALALPFRPFPVPEEQGIVLYLGLKVPNPQTDAQLAGRTITFYTVPFDNRRRAISRNERVRVASTPRWQAPTVHGWRECYVNDSAQGFLDPGIIEVKLPDDVSKWTDSTLVSASHWLRILWDSEIEEDQPPFPRRLLLNTTFALQTLCLQNELLGSSNGRPNQVFNTLYKPIIGPAKVEVREPGDQPDGQAGTEQSEESKYEFGSIKISKTVNEVWKLWSEVEGFSDSDSHSHHYVLDRLAGSICFGNGKNGRIPPPGANNIRAREYYTGGGKRGNRPSATVTQLHTTIPYVESVTNPEPSAGGQDIESLDSLRRGASARVRHRDRAISVDDYADLARRASPEVAKAACIPARDLLSDPRENQTEPGVVSVIVVPHSSHPRPRPSFDLLKNVKSFLDSRRPVGIDLVVLEPEYVSISVVAEIVWVADSSAINAIAECEKQLNRFFHPVIGGVDGHGWQFGEWPHESDVYPVLGAIEGLDHIHSLELRHKEDRPGLLLARTFLICPGMHELRLC